MFYVVGYGLKTNFCINVVQEVPKMEFFEASSIIEGE